jgi:hypothetical protein
MALDSILLIAQLCTMIIGGLCLLVALRSQKRQTQGRIFIEFSARLHEILARPPVLAWIEAESGGGELPPSNGDLTRTALHCFHIMADLYHLHESGYVSQDLWQPWQQGIRRTFRGMLMRREWTTLQTAFSHDPAFCNYVRALMEEPGPMRVLYIPYTSSAKDALTQSAF